MAFAYRGNASAAGTGVTSLDCLRPAGTQVGDFIAAVYAFENVAAGSGPWIVPNIGQLASNFIGPAEGWQQACWSAPGAAGVGIEVWVAVHGTGANQTAQFATSQNVVTVAAAWGGEYNPTGTMPGGAPRLAPTAQVTGNQPAAPSVLGNQGELVIACGADLMGASGFGSPSGFTNRVDATRAGAGSVEAAIADATLGQAGDTGLITFPNNAASTTTRGTTATLVVIPAPTATGVGPVLDAPFPADLDLADGWTLRITALDPTTGAPVSGVRVSNFAIECATVGETDAQQLAVGEFQLVPGPGA